jgi:hypothetical protein
MIGSKTLGRAVFFGLGYLAGTRAGRERYAQIEAGAKAILTQLRARYAETDGTTSPSGSEPAVDISDPYRHIKLGDG